MKIAGYAGKDAKNGVAARKKFAFPLMQCALVKSFSAATGNESALMSLLNTVEISESLCY